MPKKEAAWPGWKYTQIGSKLRSRYYYYYCVPEPSQTLHISAQLCHSEEGDY
jgi:hypothetical protein